MPGTPFRLIPKLPAEAFRTYTLAQPLATHFRVATCAEVECPRWLNGWTAELDVTTVDGQLAADWIRAESGRRYTAVSVRRGVWLFTFDAGQTCFRAKDHRTPVGKPPIALKRDGDWRGNPTGFRHIHSRLDDWVDDFATHLDGVQARKARG